MGNIRQKQFQKNNELEQALKKLNYALSSVESDLISQFSHPKYPVILVLGAPRSGTTLLTQYLSSTGLFSYPSNIISRFYDSPYIGAQIHKILIDLDINNEISLFSEEQFVSELGRVKGASAPHEFWYFWRRFFPYDDICYYDEEFLQNVDTETFLSEIAAIEDVFDKPFMCKANLICYNLLFMYELFPKCIFIHTQRDPLYNVQSILESREKFYGTEEQWYSFKIPEYKKLKEMDAVHQAAGQIYYTNKTIEAQLQNVDEKNKISINYEDFCNKPQELFDDLRKRLLEHGYVIDPAYKGIEKFDRMNHVRCGAERKKEILNAYNSFNKRVKGGNGN